MGFIRSVSIPRSGHNYLSRVLRTLLGDRLLYHKRGAMPDPADVPSGHHLLWKTHDPRLDLPVQLSGTSVIVQWREPLGAMLSEVERLKLRQGDDFAIEEDEVRLLWLAQQAIYYQDFMRKWHGSAAAHLSIDYADLCRDPIAIVARVVALFDIPMSLAEIEDAIAPHRQRKNNGSSFAPRDTARSVIIPRESLDEYDAVQRGMGDGTRLGLAVTVLRQTASLAPPGADMAALREIAMATGNAHIVSRAEKYIARSGRPAD